MLSKHQKEYYKANASYQLYKDQLTIDESPRLAGDGISLEVKCKHCGEYFIPTNTSVMSRTGALNGYRTGENNLYCSDECRQACPVYGKRDWPSENAKEPNRDPAYQAQLREMALERDDYTCQVCGATGVDLICHHIKPINESPIEAFDLDNTITVCKECEKEVVHKIPGCGYYELRCGIDQKLRK